MRAVKLLADAKRQRTLSRWLWFLAAYLLIVYVLMIVGGQVGVPSPIDVGWTD